MDTRKLIISYRMRNAKITDMSHVVAWLMDINVVLF